MRRIAAALLACALAGCARARPGDVPTVRYGTDPCARCGMVVSEERFAGGYVDREGRAVVFDDPGELVAAQEADPAIKDAAYVHDAATGAWLRARDAVFVRVPGLATPMGSGTAAFATRAEADRFIAELAGR